MLKYLFVILDTSANSFCYYRNPIVTSQLIDLQALKDVIFFAQKENMIINFLIGKEKLPKEYLDVMGTINHIIISSYGSQINNDEDIFVVDYNNENQKPEISNHANVILRIEKIYLSELASIIKDVKVNKRINIVLLDIDTYTESDFDKYKKQLEVIKNSYAVGWNENSQMELNILSDILVLTRMNNCDAGIMHITFAPNGKFYICPAFYFENESDSAGDLINGVNIRNKQLYALEYAPICRKCDAFQCKRCSYLNRKTTMEVNTPSHEQCVVSHLERNLSGALLFSLQKSDIYNNVENIPSINYLDPFDLINEDLSLSK